jgi:hypothetical protein
MIYVPKGFAHGFLTLESNSELVYLHDEYYNPEFERGINYLDPKLKIILQSKNYIQIGCFIFLLISIMPLLPSGAFFSDYNFTIFWLNVSLMYSVNNKTNVFSKN